MMGPKGEIVSDFLADATIQVHQILLELLVNSFNWYEQTFTESNTDFVLGREHEVLMEIQAPRVLQGPL